MSENNKKSSDKQGEQQSHHSRSGTQSHTPSDDPRGAGLTASDREGGQNRGGRTTSGTGP